MSGAVLVTYRPLGERDAAARIGATLAAHFGARRIVFVPRLRPERFQATGAIVALLARGDNTPEFNRWLSDLRVASQAGVPVALVLMDGAAQPPAQLWPSDSENAVVLPLSTPGFDRDVAQLIAILAPLVRADDPVADPASPIVVPASSIAAPNGRPITASYGPGAPTGPDPSDPDLPEMLDDEPTEIEHDDSELESLVNNKFAPRPAPSSPAEPFETAALPTPLAASDPGAESTPAITERLPTTALRSGPWTPPPTRPLTVARMPDSPPWPAAIRPAGRGFATAPLSASGAATSQPAGLDPGPTEALRPRGGVWIAALGVAIIVAGAALAYVFRSEIAALINPIANNLFHRPPPAS